MTLPQENISITLLERVVRKVKYLKNLLKVLSFYTHHRLPSEWLLDNKTLKLNIMESLIANRFCRN